VLLDVQMPGLTGLDVVREIGPEQMPATVFVTAYDHHALAAFDAEAVDYLLKPFDVERLRRALDRARRAVRLREIDAFRDRLASLIGGGRAEPEQERAAYQERFAVESRGQTKVVPVAAVDYVTSDGPYAELHVEDETFVIRETMQALEARLDPDRFVRIHRSTIVNLDRVREARGHAHGEYVLGLRDGTRLKVSRTYSDRIRQFLDGLS